jgi:hypothetical protein
MANSSAGSAADHRNKHLSVNPPHQIFKGILIASFFFFLFSPDDLGLCFESLSLQRLEHNPNFSV